MNPIEMHLEMIGKHFLGPHLPSWTCRAFLGEIYSQIYSQTQTHSQIEKRDHRNSKQNKYVCLYSIMLTKQNVLVAFFKL